MSRKIRAKKETKKEAKKGQRALQTAIQAKKDQNDFEQKRDAVANEEITRKQNKEKYIADKAKYKQEAFERIEQMAQIEAVTQKYKKAVKQEELDKHQLNKINISSYLNKQVVQFLWNSKIKSRDSFLLILEFITPELNNYKMPILRKFLFDLRPNGWGFFQKYVKNSYQFKSQVTRYTKEYKWFQGLNDQIRTMIQIGRQSKKHQFILAKNIIDGISRFMDQIKQILNEEQEKYFKYKQTTNIYFTPWTNIQVGLYQGQANSLKVPFGLGIYIDPLQMNVIFGYFRGQKVCKEYPFIVIESNGSGQRFSLQKE